MLLITSVQILTRITCVHKLPHIHNHCGMSPEGPTSCVFIGRLSPGQKVTGWRAAYGEACFYNLKLKTGKTGSGSGNKGE